MKLVCAFDQFKKQNPDRCIDIEKTSLALRRGGIDTVEKLQAAANPEILMKLRDIGPSRMKLIEKFLESCPEEQ